jgi:hypothetical protein
LQVNKNRGAPFLQSVGFVSRFVQILHPFGAERPLGSVLRLLKNAIKLNASLSCPADSCFVQLSNPRFATSNFKLKPRRYILKVKIDWKQLFMNSQEKSAEIQDQTPQRLPNH